jgi:hypothetical protein
VEPPPHPGLSGIKERDLPGLRIRAEAPMRAFHRRREPEDAKARDVPAIQDAVPHHVLFDNGNRASYNSRPVTTNTVSCGCEKTRRRNHMQFMQSAQFWIAFIAVLIMAGGVAIVYQQVVKQNAVIGMQAIRFIGMVFILPILLILGLFSVLHAETIGTIIGVVVGYVLTLMGKQE